MNARHFGAMSSTCFFLASLFDASASPTTRTPLVLRYVSMNDAGQVAFIGSITDDSGNVIQNIYTINSATPSQLNLLMNTAFELPDKGIGTTAPSQAFSAPMIKNNGNIVAWRYMGAVVVEIIEDYISPPEDLGLTYIEEWPFAGTPSPTADLPIQQIAMGNGNYNAVYPYLTWVNPAEGYMYPSQYDTSSPWIVVFGPGNSLPAQNNNGLVAFCGITINGGDYYLTTSAAPGPAQSFLLPSGHVAFPRISDSGLVVATIINGTSSNLTLFTDPADLTTSTILAGPGTGFKAIGPSPCINDAGTIVVFYGNYQGANSALHKGPGVFAAINTEGTWTLVRVATASDETYIASNLGVNNSRQIVYKGKNTKGSLALFAKTVSQKRPFVLSPPVTLQSVGDNSQYGTITDLEFYAGLANTGDVAYWIQADTAHVIEKAIRPVLGIDVTHKQGTIEWSKVAKSDISFVFVKATQGNTFPDPDFLPNIQQAQDNHLLVAPYHFAGNGTAPPYHLQDPVVEADYFLSFAGRYIGNRYLPPILDVDELYGLSGSTLSAWAQAWLEHVQLKTGVTPMLYTQRSVLLQLDSALQAYPLWIANYPSNPTSTPTYKKKFWYDWVFQQYHEGQAADQFPGISSKYGIDLDSFNGSYDHLRGLTIHP